MQLSGTIERSKFVLTPLTIFLNRPPNPYNKVFRSGCCGLPREKVILLLLALNSQYKAGNPSGVFNLHETKNTTNIISCAQSMSGFQVFFNAGSDKRQYYSTDHFLSSDAVPQF